MKFWRGHTFDLVITLLPMYLVEFTLAFIGQFVYGFHVFWSEHIPAHTTMVGRNIAVNSELLTTASTYLEIREFAFYLCLRSDALLGISLGLLGTFGIELALFIVGLREPTKLFSYASFDVHRHRRYCIIEELRYIKSRVILNFGSYMAAFRSVDELTFLAVSSTISAAG